MSTFFVKEEKDLEFYVWQATRLANVIRSHFGTSRPINIKHWAKDIKALHSHPDVVERVMSWYIDNVGKPFVPIVRSAKSFKEKFEALEAAMERSNPTLEISTDVVDIQRRLGDLSWPTMTKDNELQLIQATRNNYLRWWRMVRDEVQTNGFAKYLLSQMHPVDFFVELHVRDVHRAVHAGRLADREVGSLAWSPRWWSFENEMIVKSQEYMNSCLAWTQLKAILRDENR